VPDKPQIDRLSQFLIVNRVKVQSRIPGSSPKRQSYDKDLDSETDLNGTLDLGETIDFGLWAMNEYGTG
jgi:hypothetical protein